jgi:hypothetical protein
MGTMTSLSCIIFSYTGCENLEAMTFAENYNRYLYRLIISHRSGGGQMVDFGAGTGTFALR